MSEFFVLAEHCLEIWLYGLDIGLEFQTRLWHYWDINGEPCSLWNEIHLILVGGFWPLTSITKGSVWGAVVGFLDTFWLLPKFVIYLIKNIHSYLSKVFLEALFGEHFCHVGAMQHDLPCKSVELLLYAASFCWEVLSKRKWFITIH